MVRAGQQNKTIFNTVLPEMERLQQSCPQFCGQSRQVNHDAGPAFYILAYSIVMQKPKGQGLHCDVTVYGWPCLPIIRDPAIIKQQILLPWYPLQELPLFLSMGNIIWVTWVGAEFIYCQPLGAQGRSTYLTWTGNGECLKHSAAALKYALVVLPTSILVCFLWPWC